MTQIRHSLKRGTSVIGNLMTRGNGGWKEMRSTLCKAQI
ncbi:hypothetical protein VCHA39O220_40235 [Vibrio chagasii]|nr:hypothetical protein VCHA39O220_40235 [Vibrio chagasii]